MELMPQSITMAPGLIQSPCAWYGIVYYSTVWYGIYLNKVCFANCNNENISLLDNRLGNACEQFNTKTYLHKYRQISSARVSDRDSGISAEKELCYRAAHDVAATYDYRMLTSNWNA